MDPNTLNLIKGAAGTAGGDPAKYVEEVFSTDLYNGVDSPSAITVDNGIDLSGEGGMVWFARRSHAQWHSMFDTERGTEKVIYSDQTSGEGTNTGSLTSFNDDGFTIGTHGYINDDDGFGNTTTHVAWTFRKAKGFFDVVTWTGSGTTDTDHRISHSLGCVPGCILVKKTDGTQDWRVYHKEVGVDSYQALNNNTAFTSGFNCFGSAPTSTDFGINEDNLSMSSGNFVAYLFADGDEAAAQIFGDNEDEAIIKCGNYEGDGQSAGFFHSLGFEPQWLLLKDADSASDWIMVDDMRGWSIGEDQDGSSPILHPHLSNAEQANTGKLSPRATGINIDGSSSWVNTDDKNFIYIAIRRGPMKTPEDATKVFAVDYGNASSTIPCWDSGFPVDLAFWKYHEREYHMYANARLCGTTYLRTSTTAVEANDGDLTWDSNVGWGKTWPTTTISWMFRRAPGFCDVVCYKGAASAAVQTINHNLGVAPELIICKGRNFIQNWITYHASCGHTHFLKLDSSDAASDQTWPWNDTAPTATQFTVGSSWDHNRPDEMHVAYLFASCPGVSKIGTYTGAGSGTDVNVDCGFDAGARLVLIKGKDQGGHWFIYDTTRGIVAGNDPFCKMNSDQQCNAGDEDRVDPYTSGFTVSGSDQNHNTLNDTYIYLAIA